MSSLKFFIHHKLNEPNSSLVGNLMSDVGKAYENKDERVTKTITNKVD